MFPSPFPCTLSPTRAIALPRRSLRHRRRAPTRHGMPHVWILGHNLNEAKPGRVAFELDVKTGRMSGPAPLLVSWGLPRAPGKPALLPLSSCSALGLVGASVQME